MSQNTSHAVSELIEQVRVSPTFFDDPIDEDEERDVECGPNCGLFPDPDAEQLAQDVVREMRAG